MYRQGDLFIDHVDALPDDAAPRQSLTLLEGEATGHAHRVRDAGSAVVSVSRSAGMFLEVTEPAATIVHEEHGPITLERGTYRIWRQREYAPDRTRFVRD